MNEIAGFQSIRELTDPERLQFCAQEVQRLTPPRNDRERVLANVYHHLLQTDRQCAGVSPKTRPDRETVDAALFVAVENEATPVNAWSYRRYAIRQLYLLWQFVRRPRHPTLQHATVGVAFRRDDGRSIAHRD